METQLTATPTDGEADLATLLAVGDGTERGPLPPAVGRTSQGGGEVVELSGATWRTATRSSHTECVEVADNLPGVVAVRDSKDRQGPVLAFTPQTWRSFVQHVGRP